MDGVILDLMTDLMNLDQRRDGVRDCDEVLWVDDDVDDLVFVDLVLDLVLDLALDDW